MNPKQLVLSLCPCGNLLISVRYYAAMEFILTNSFVADWLYISARADLFVKGRAKNKLFGAKAFNSSCVALRLDFAGNARSFLRGFCTVPQGWCSVCRP